MSATSTVPEYGTAPVARSATIVDGTVVTADLANGAVTAEKTATAVQTSLGKADTAYQKPGTGIPSTDMTAAVQASLGLADSATQPGDLGGAAVLDVGTAAGTVAAGDDSRIVAGGTALQPLTYRATTDAAVTAVAGEFLRCSVADAEVSVTLPSAATAGAGARVVAQLDDDTSAGNNLIVLAADAGSNVTLTGADETLEVVSDGAVWRVVNRTPLPVGQASETVCAGDDARLQVAESTTLCTVDDSAITTAETATFTCTPDPVWVAAAVEPAGTIQLYRAGSTAVGTAQALVAGTVDIAVLGSALGEGVHTITAVFTPDPTTPWLGSTSAGVEVTVSTA